MTTWAFDADVLIYAANPDDELGARVRELLARLPNESAFGSVLLLPEVLTKPRRSGSEAKEHAVRALLARLTLLDVTGEIAARAVHLGATYGLRSVDAVHLATAVDAAADTFLTNNHNDFRPDRIGEIEVVFPENLQV